MKATALSTIEERVDEIRSGLMDAKSIDAIKETLRVLPDHELEAVYQWFLDKYGRDLADGALERFIKFRGVLLIVANQDIICLVRRLLDALRDEIVDRWTLAFYHSNGTYKECGLPQAQPPQQEA